MNIRKWWHYYKTKKRTRVLAEGSDIVDAISFLENKVVFIERTFARTYVKIKRKEVSELISTSHSDKGILEKIGHTTFVFANSENVSVCNPFYDSGLKRHDLGIKNTLFVRRINEYEFVVVTSSNELYYVTLGDRFSIKTSMTKFKTWNRIENVFVDSNSKIFLKQSNEYFLSFKKNKKGSYVQTDFSCRINNDCLSMERFVDKFLVLDATYGMVYSNLDNKDENFKQIAWFERNGSMHFNSLRVNRFIRGEFYICMNDSYESIIRRYQFRDGKIKDCGIVARFNDPTCRIKNGMGATLLVVSDSNVFELKL